MVTVHISRICTSHVYKDQHTVLTPNTSVLYLRCVHACLHSHPGYINEGRRLLKCFHLAVPLLLYNRWYCPNTVSFGTLAEDIVKEYTQVYMERIMKQRLLYLIASQTVANLFSLTEQTYYPWNGVMTWYFAGLAVFSRFKVIMSLNLCCKIVPYKLWVRRLSWFILGQLTLSTFCGIIHFRGVLVFCEICGSAKQHIEMSTK